MLTDKKTRRRKLSVEVLGILAMCLAVSVFLYLFLSMFGVVIIEEYCWQNDITPDSYLLNGAVFSVSLAVSVIFFVVLFLILFGERLAYIQRIIGGVDAMQSGELGHKLELEGNNELTQLAEAINYLSDTQKQIKEKDRRINQEKEELIRTLSHDIRTPLTSLLAYSELMISKQDPTAEEQREYALLVRRKSQQIKEITDILLDGSKRSPEHFDNARVLMEQLASEFEEALENDYSLAVDLSGCPNFQGSFDVQEMRRIFDNLISNVQKYADPAHPVRLEVRKEGQDIIIKQSNAVRKDPLQAESYHLGLISIRRIAHSYGGSTDVIQNDSFFEITVTLSEI